MWEILTNCPASVDHGLISLSFVFVGLSRLVEDLWILRVSVVHSKHTMTPAMAHHSLSLSKELLVLLELFKLSELLLQSLELLSHHRWCLQFC